MGLLSPFYPLVGPQNRAVSIYQTVSLKLSEKGSEQSFDGAWCQGKGPKQGLFGLFRLLVGLCFSHCGDFSDNFSGNSTV